MMIFMMMQWVSSQGALFILNDVVELLMMVLFMMLLFMMMQGVLFQGTLFIFNDVDDDDLVHDNINDDARGFVPGHPFYIK